MNFFESVLEVFLYVVFFQRIMWTDLKILSKAKKHFLFNKWQSVIMKIYISHESCIDNPDMLSSCEFTRLRNSHHNLAPAMIK